MTALLWSLLSPVRRALAWAVGGLAILGGVWVAAKRDARQEAETEAAEGYAQTRKKSDEADIVGSDPDVLRDWLRNRDPDQR